MKYLCHMCDEVIDLDPYDIVIQFKKKYHEKLVDKGTYVWAKMCGPIEKVNKDEEQ